MDTTSLSTYQKRWTPDVMFTAFTVLLFCMFFIKLVFRIISFLYVPKIPSSQHGTAASTSSDIQVLSSRNTDGGDTTRPSSDGGGTRRSSSDEGSTRRSSSDGGDATRSSSDEGGTTRSSSDGGGTTRSSSDGGGTTRSSSDEDSTRRSSSDEGSTRRSSSDGGDATRSSSDEGSTRRSSSDEGGTTRSSSDGGSTRRSSSDGGSTRRSSSDEGSTRRSSSDGGDTTRSSSDEGGTTRSSSDEGGTTRSSYDGGDRTTSSAVKDDCPEILEKFGTQETSWPKELKNGIQETSQGPEMSACETRNVVELVEGSENSETCFPGDESSVQVTRNFRAECLGNTCSVADNSLPINSVHIQHPTQTERSLSALCISGITVNLLLSAGDGEGNPSMRAADTHIPAYDGSENLESVEIDESGSSASGIAFPLDFCPVNDICKEDDANVEEFVNAKEVAPDDAMKIPVPRADSFSKFWNTCAPDCLLSILSLHLLWSPKLRKHLHEWKEMCLGSVTKATSVDEDKYNTAHLAMLKTYEAILAACTYCWDGKFDKARSLVCPGLRDMYGSERQRTIPFLAPTFLELYNNTCSSDNCFSMFYPPPDQLMVNIAPELLDLCSQQGVQAAVDRYMTVDKRTCEDWRPNGSCTGTRTTLRHFAAPPPFIPINMNGLNITEEDIDPNNGSVNLNRKLTVDGESYQLAGIVFHRPDHFTAKIRIPEGDGDKSEETFLHYDGTGKLSQRADPAVGVVPRISHVYYALIPK